jgi:hypothetical protein
MPPFFHLPFYGEVDKIAKRFFGWGAVLGAESGPPPEIFSRAYTVATRLENYRPPHKGRAIAYVG